MEFFELLVSLSDSFRLWLNPAQPGERLKLLAEGASAQVVDLGVTLVDSNSMKTHQQQASELTAKQRLHVQKILNIGWWMYANEEALERCSDLVWELDEMLDDFDFKDHEQCVQALKAYRKEGRLLVALMRNYEHARHASSEPMPGSAITCQRFCDKEPIEVLPAVTLSD